MKQVISKDLKFYDERMYIEKHTWGDKSRPHKLILNKMSNIIEKP
jgi:hypothetical protein